MNRIVRGSVVATTLVVIAALAPHADAQNAYKPPRTSWGEPDLQGLWPSTHMVSTPFERPAEFGDRLYLTDAEFKARQKQAEHQGAVDLESVDVEQAAGKEQDMITGGISPPPHWLERGEPQRQSSLIVDPPNGRLPPMTAEGAARQKALKNTYLQQSGFGSYADLGPYDRCISRGPVGSMMPVIYNDGNEFVQSPGFIAFRNEMIHETRVIPLDGRGHVAASVKSYMGDSRGRWDGDTLVVETTNLNGRTGAQGNGMMLMMSDAAKITERFARTGADTLRYEVAVDDPKTWTKPWKASFELRREPDYQLFEYACHEGNHAMRNVLSAARATEATEAAAAPR
jgi:hypothetical protein